MAENSYSPEETPQNSKIYKDTLANRSLGKEISEALGIEDKLTFNQKEGSIPLVEFRQEEGATSITAHGPHSFVELVVLDAGKTELKETNGETGKQMKTTLWPDGRVERTVQQWNNKTGLTGTQQNVEVTNATVMKTRVEQIARRVLPLARKI